MARRDAAGHEQRALHALPTARAIHAAHAVAVSVLAGGVGGVGAVWVLACDECVVCMHMCGILCVGGSVSAYFANP